MSIVSLKDISVHYGDHLAIKGISGAFSKSSLTAIVGPNGSGKSTLLKLIMGQITPTTGEVGYHNITPQEIAYLPQQLELDRHFPLLVEDVVAMGLWKQIGSFQKISQTQTESLYRALDHVGLKGFEKRPLHQLSGGQFQKVLFARMIVQDAPVILLDEPFSAVDEETIEDLMGLVQEWGKEGRTVIVVLHDRALVEKYFPMTLRINQSLISWGPTSCAFPQERGGIHG